MREREKLQSFIEYLEVHSLKIYFPLGCRQSQLFEMRGDIDEDKMYQLQSHTPMHMCIEILYLKCVYIGIHKNMNL